MIISAEEKLFIVMELIEGAPIGEHFNSLKEKEEHFSEDRIWHIFVQVTVSPDGHSIHSLVTLTLIHGEYAYFFSRC